MSAPALSHADALDLLDLPPESSSDVIRQAFRTHAKSVHPDLTGGMDDALRRLIDARDILLNEVAARPQRIERLTHTTDVAPIEIVVSLGEAISGGMIHRDLPGFDIDPSSPRLTSLTQTFKVHVLLPAGVRDGEVVSLPTPGTGAATRTFVVRIAADSASRVFGDDIWMTAAIAPRLFASGGTAKIQTPWGFKDIEIARGLPPGAGLCLDGLGLPATPRHKAGKLFVRLVRGSDAPATAKERLDRFTEQWLRPVG